MKIFNKYPYLIAEIGVNFYDIAKKEGMSDMAAAKFMIDEAQACGVDAVKFQSYKAETIASKNSPTPILYSCIYCFIHLLIIYIISLLIPDVCTAGKLVNLLISYIGAPILSIFIVYLTTKDTKRKPYYKKRKLR